MSTSEDQSCTYSGRDHHNGPGTNQIETQKVVVRCAGALDNSVFGIMRLCCIMNAIDTLDRYLLKWMMCYSYDWSNMRFTNMKVE